MAQFIQNIIDAARTANDRDSFNMYDYIGATLAALFVVAIFIIAGLIENS